METSIQQNIGSYLELLNQIKDKVQDERTALSLLTEICKDRRVVEMRKEREQQNNEPASKKQISYLRDLGVDIRKFSNLTREQASKLIDEALE